MTGDRTSPRRAGGCTPEGLGSARERGDGSCDADETDAADVPGTVDAPGAADDPGTADDPGDGSEPGAAESAPAALDATSARREIRDVAERLRRRERDRAVERLAERGDLTPEQRRIVDELAARLVDGVLDAPEAALEAAATDGEAPERDAAGGPVDDETAGTDLPRIAVELFDPER